MAQMLSPVCTDALKINQNPSRRLFSKPTTITVTTSAWRVSKRRRSLLGKRVKVATDGSLSTDTVADDYYTVLGLLPDATPGQIKKAYYNCMKACHPDLSGDDPETTNFCMFINEVYEVLSDPVQRMIYDEIHGYALTATNPFLDDSKAKDHVFVDEFSCIGCKNCANIAGDVFTIEEDFGRARAYCQSGARDLVQQAIDSCPVDCIHWTSAAQLSLLEDEMRRVERVNVAFMLSGMGASAVDVFRVASSRWEKRQAKVLAQAKMRMTKQKDPSKAESYWDNLWGKPNEYKSSVSKPTLIWNFLQKRKWKKGRSERQRLHEDGGSTPGVVLTSLPLLSYRRPCPTRISECIIICIFSNLIITNCRMETNASSLYRWCTNVLLGPWDIY